MFSLHWFFILEVATSLLMARLSLVNPPLFVFMVYVACGGSLSSLRSMAASPYLMIVSSLFGGSIMNVDPMHYVSA
jgi:hypothetical protein